MRNNRTLNTITIKIGCDGIEHFCVFIGSMEGGHEVTLHGEPMNVVSFTKNSKIPLTEFLVVVVWYFGCGCAPPLLGVHSNRCAKHVVLGDKASILV